MRVGAIRRVPGAGTLPSELRGGIVAIGNFDGVHRGHQAVLGEASRIAESTGRPLVCLTFEPHPRTVFRPEHPVARLTPPPMKARLLDALGFDAVVEQPFDAAFAAHTAEAFVDEVLLEGLGAVHVVVGFDFRFGLRRLGTTAFLAEAAKMRGFGLSVVQGFADEGGNLVSSSRIREDLMNGDAPEAAGLLGYRWTFEGSVAHGQKLGRTLGYPTANMNLQNDDLLRHGIYAVRLRRADGSIHQGVASYGRRPTFDNGAALFETHLFDFSGDLYGENASISLFAFLRGEERFASVEELIRQMDRDSAEARAVLANAAPLSALDAKIAF